MEVDGSIIVLDDIYRTCLAPSRVGGLYVIRDTGLVLDWYNR